MLRGHTNVIRAMIASVAISNETKGIQNLIVFTKRSNITPYRGQWATGSFIEEKSPLNEMWRETAVWIESDPICCFQIGDMGISTLAIIVCISNTKPTKRGSVDTLRSRVPWV